MKKFLGKIVIFSTIMAMSMGVLSGCKPSTPVANESKTATDAGETKEEKEATGEHAIDTSKFAAITWYHFGEPKPNGQIEEATKEWNAILKEKVNASLELKFIEWADYLSKYNLLLASGEAFDMCYSASTWLDMWANAEKGSFYDITELLPVYAPVTYNEIPQSDWDQAKYKGKIITIPENSFTQWVNHGFIYRGDWAKEAGITEPIKNFETMEKYFDWIKANKPEAYPWDANKNSFKRFVSGYITAYTDSELIEIPTELFYNKSVSDKYTVISPNLDRDFMIEFANMAKRWGDKGFWRADVLNYEGDPKEKFRAGASGAEQHHTMTFGGLRSDMDRDIPIDLVCCHMAAVKLFILYGKAV